MRTGWISYYITFKNYVIAISGCELITPLDRLVVLNRDHHNFLHLYLISLKSLKESQQSGLKKKGGKSMDNMSQIVLTMEEDMSKRSNRLVKEGTTTWQIDKKETFEIPRKRFG